MTPLPQRAGRIAAAAIPAFPLWLDALGRGTGLCSMLRARAVLVLLAATVSRGQTGEELRALSLEELLQQEVSLVSRHPERLSESPSAAQVITGEDIRRSGAATLPESLRLAPNLQVAQQGAQGWAITARGFNATPLSNQALANKLLVMIDGRSVYTPLFGGVFWDVQNVLLEDLDRIEVVSGPGAALWGSNAVNGVINVVSKSAKDTQGVFVSTEMGTFTQNVVAARYGGKAGPRLFYRVYGQRLDHHASRRPDGRDARDDWFLNQGGFRADYYPSGADTFTFQGDYYQGRGGETTHTRMDGQSVLGRWGHVFASGSELTVQGYWDRAAREFVLVPFQDEVTTWDLDTQFRFAAGDRHVVTVGGESRIMRDKTVGSAGLFFTPARRTLRLMSVFVQDVYALVPDRLDVTLGARCERTEYAGTEFQPNLRLKYRITDHQTAWAAVSRAIRAPSRFDVDETTPFLSTPSRSFDSEKVSAFEVGYRARPAQSLLLSVAFYYHRYEDLRSLNRNPAPPPRLVFANDQEADGLGAEVAATWQPHHLWRIRAGYTFLDHEVRPTSPLVQPGSDRFEAIDPKNQAMVQATLDLPYNLQFDFVGRYVSSLPSSLLPTQRLPAYATADVRMAWWYRTFEVSVGIKNAFDSQHPEFGEYEIPRSLYAKVACRW